MSRAVNLNSIAKNIEMARRLIEISHEDLKNIKALREHVEYVHSMHEITVGLSIISEVIEHQKEIQNAQ